MAKAYSSQEYFAQEFAVHLRKYLRGFGAEYPVSILQGNRVEVQVQDIKADLEFLVEDEKIRTILTMKKNSEDPKPIIKRLKVVRTKTGRVSPNTYEGLIKNQVMPKLREAHERFNEQ